MAVLRERLVKQERAGDRGISGVGDAQHRDSGDAVGNGKPLPGKAPPLASDDEGQRAAIVNVPVGTAAGRIGGDDAEPALPQPLSRCRTADGDDRHGQRGSHARLQHKRVAQPESLLDNQHSRSAGAISAADQRAEVAREIPAIGDHQPGAAADADIAERPLTCLAEGGDAVRAVPVRKAGYDPLTPQTEG
jgi:hypothetical protein